MARILIRQAHGGQTRIISDPALPYFLNQGWVELDNYDDTEDIPPVYLSRAEGDLRWASIADLGDPASAEVVVISETVADILVDPATGPGADLREAFVPVESPLAHGGALDGITDDTPAWEAAATAIDAAGGGLLLGVPGESTVIRRRDSTDQKSGGIPLWSNSVFDGQGMTLLLKDNCDFITVRGTVGTVVTVTADTTAAATTLTVGDSSGFTVGGEVLVRLGQAPYDEDEAEPEHWFYAKVTATATGLLTLDRPIGYVMTVASTPAGLRTVQTAQLVENVEIRGVNMINPMTGGASAEHGIRIEYARNIRVDDISGENTGAGIVSTQYAENIHGAGHTLRSSEDQDGSGYRGRGYSIAETRNLRFENVRARGFEGLFAMVEAQAEGIVFAGVEIENSHATRSPSSPLVACFGNSDVELQRPIFFGAGAALTQQSEYLGRVRYLNPVFHTSIRPYIDDLGEVAGSLQVNDTVWSLHRTFRRGFRVTASGNPEIPLPAGLITGMRVFVSSAVGITYGLVLSTGGESGNFATLLTGGQTKDVGLLPSGAHGFGPAGYGANAADGGKQIVLTTDATVPAGTYGMVEVDMLMQPGTDAEDLAGGHIGDTLILRDKDDNTALVYLDAADGIVKVRGIFGTITSIGVG